MSRVTMNYRVDDLKNKLDALAKQITSKDARGLPRRSLYAAGVVLRDKARANVSVRTGALKKAIVYRDRVNRDQEEPAVLQAKVTVSGGGYVRTPKGKARRVKKGEKATIRPRKIAALVEFGTKPHSVRAGSRKGSIPPKAKPHPGAKPKPFMRPALATGADEAVDAFKVKALADIEAIAQRK